MMWNNNQQLGEITNVMFFFHIFHYFPFSSSYGSISNLDKLPNTSWKDWMQFSYSGIRIVHICFCSNINHIYSRKVNYNQIPLNNTFIINSFIHILRMSISSYSSSYQALYLCFMHWQCEENRFSMNDESFFSFLQLLYFVE